jgi:L-fuconolactonase
MNRRQFLTVSAATSVANVWPTRPLLADAQEDRVFPVIDTHQHLWDLSRFRLPWHKDEPMLAKDHLPADYQSATADLGQVCGKPAQIVKTVYMEVDVDPAQQTDEARYVLDLCSRPDNPMVAAVISGRPASANFAKYVEQFRNITSIKGIRQVLHGPSTPAGYCLDSAFIRGIRLLGELGLSFDLCMRPGELLDAAKLIDSCPDTRFILDHCGNGDVQAKDRSQWEKGMAEVARRKNVVCKVSGIVVTARPQHWTADDLAPIIHHTLEVFGPARVMFGGDWPVCTKTASFRQWFRALVAIVSERPEEQQLELFHDNATRFYHLE